MYKELIGKPFIDGGRDLTGFDCWGLAYYIYKNYYNIELPDYLVPCMDSDLIYGTYQKAREDYKLVTGEIPVPALVLMRFHSRYISHIGVYIGNGKFIHAQRNIGVCIERTDSMMWKNNIVEYRIPNLEEGISIKS